MDATGTKEGSPAETQFRILPVAMNGFAINSLWIDAAPGGGLVLWGYKNI